MRTLTRSAIAALTLVACTEPSALRLAMTVDRTALVAQDSVKLSLVLVNQSARTVRTIAPDGYGLCMHAFQVFDDQDREVPVITGFCIAASLVAPQQTDLLPGHSISITDYWNPGAASNLAGAVAPGKYRVVGLVYGDDEAVRSGPTIITVLP